MRPIPIRCPVGAATASVGGSDPVPVIKTRDASTGIGVAVRHLLKSHVVVGIPDTAAERKPEDGGKGTPPSNATIGYAMEFGLPDKNVPARPFLIPGTESVKNEVAMRLAKAGEAALTGDPAAVERGLEAVGIVAADAVRRRITDGPFAPLSQRTIEARAARGRKGARQFLKLQGEGTPDAVLHDARLVVPLIDSGQLRRSVQYLVRNK